VHISVISVLCVPVTDEHPRIRHSRLLEREKRAAAGAKSFPPGLVGGKRQEDTLQKRNEQRKSPFICVCVRIQERAAGRQN
jgi:hypothetical protein